MSFLPNASFPACTILAVMRFINVTLTILFGGLFSIYSSTFASCRSLESFYLLNCSVAVRQPNAFSNTPMVSSTFLERFGSIYVPEQAVSLYKAPRTGQ